MTSLILIPHINPPSKIQFHQVYICVMVTHCNHYSQFISATGVGAILSYKTNLGATNEISALVTLSCGASRTIIDPGPPSCPITPTISVNFVYFALAFGLSKVTFVTFAPSLLTIEIICCWHI